MTRAARSKLARLEALAGSRSVSEQGLRVRIYREYMKLLVWSDPDVAEYLRRLAMGNDAEECNREREADYAAYAAAAGQNQP